MLGVFLVSAVVHEYIFCFVLGFFYPVILMLFLVFGGELGLCATGGGAIQREEAWAPAPGDSRLMGEATHPRQKGMCVPSGERHEGCESWGGTLLGTGSGAASGSSKGYPGGCGRRCLIGEEHLSRAPLEGDRRVKTGVGFGGSV